MHEAKSVQGYEAFLPSSLMQGLVQSYLGQYGETEHFYTQNMEKRQKGPGINAGEMQNLPKSTHKEGGPDKAPQGKSWGGGGPGSYHSQRHAVNLVLVFGFMLPERAVPEERKRTFVQAADGD